MKWLAKRKDIDPRRIAVVGHSEGGAVAMLAAAREKKISSLVLIAAPGTPGADLVLEQQRHLLDVMKVPDAERQAKIELQTADPGGGDHRQGLGGDSAGAAGAGRLAVVPEPAAVRSGEGHAEDQAADPRSSRAISTSRCSPHHADTLAALARARKKAPPVEVVHLPGINHLLVPAETGDVSEDTSRCRTRAITPRRSAKAIAELV